MEDAFVVAANQILGDKNQHIACFEEMLPLLADTSKLEEELSLVRAKHNELLDELRCYMEENTRRVQDQVEYNWHFTEMSENCKKVEEQIAEIQADILAQQGRKEQIRRCIDELRQRENFLDEFDLDLWNATVESVTVSTDKTLTFRFRDGTEVPVHLPEK